MLGVADRGNSVLFVDNLYRFICCVNNACDVMYESRFTQRLQKLIYRSKFVYRLFHEDFSPIDGAS